MQLSTFAIEALGFERIPVDGTLSAAFHRLHVFAVRGFTVAADALVTQQGTIGDASFSIGVAESINAICESLVGQQFTEDEAAWAKEKHAVPPYLVVHVGPTSTHTATHGFAKNHDGEIISYDTFGAAKKELRQLDKQVLASIEMALSIAFEAVTPPVTFYPVDTATFGLTPDNVVVHDLRITGNADGFVSRPIGLAQIGEHVSTVIDCTRRLDVRVARFFQLGRRDQDNLKRFLYYFIAIEIETHRVFEATVRSVHLDNSAAFDSRIGNAVKQMLEAKSENWKNLADRFIWCVTSTWTHLTTSDIQEFKKLKKIRDDIAHGKISEPKPSDVAAVARLATKLHLQPPPAGV